MGKAEIYPVSEIQFFVKDNTTIKLTIDNEKVTGMVIYLMGLGVRIMSAESF